jgi:hypothetical protein
MINEVTRLMDRIRAPRYEWTDIDGECNMSFMEEVVLTFVSIFLIVCSTVLISFTLIVGG